MCHGHAGNADLLLYASQILANPEYESIAQRVGSEGIEWYEKEKIPWPCGSQQGHETPDLMLGTAGIGYFYLRLHHAATNPPVLIIVPDEGRAAKRREPPT
ncbi:MAG: hypothetical protein HY238_28640 [Acidobacteria bacterium]|nr:hypothetical protein [Acidobacteriota bacterium]